MNLNYDDWKGTAPEDDEPWRCPECGRTRTVCMCAEIDRRVDELIEEDYSTKEIEK